MRKFCTFFFILLFLLIAGKLLSQNPTLDSLHTVWENFEQPDSIRVDAFNNYISSGFIKSNTNKALVLIDDLVRFCNQRNYKKGLAIAFNLKGKAYYIKTQYSQALDYYIKSLTIAKEINYKKSIAKSLSDIGVVNYFQKEYSLALDYFEKSLKIREEINDVEGVALSLNNLGLMLKIKGRYEDALASYQRAIDIRKSTLDNVSISYPLNNIGEVYSAKKEYQKALAYYQQSIAVKEQTDDKYGIRYTLNRIGQDYLAQQAFKKAIINCYQALDISKEIGDMQGQIESYNCLYVAYKSINKPSKALLYFEQKELLNDSLNNVNINLKLQQIEFDKKVLADSISQIEKTRLIEITHQKEIEILNRRKVILQSMVVLFLLMASTFFISWRFVKKSKDVLKQEKDKSEKLLLNILPKKIADELKLTGKITAREHPSTSVLFTDIVGFTAYSNKLNAQQLVLELNSCFKVFDEICAKYQIEKIKTMGDSYMAASGLHNPDLSTVDNIIHAAIEMLEFINNRNFNKLNTGKLPYEIRAGIHTGPIAAGVVGNTKFQYDIWGDTVNIASRMETNGIPGKINISDETYLLIKDNKEFLFEERGLFDVKGKGKIKMWFVTKA